MLQFRQECLPILPARTHYSFLMRLESRANHDVQSKEDTSIVSGAPSASEGARADLIALFRLLLKQPPKEHDFRTCPICKRFGITGI